MTANALLVGALLLLLGSVTTVCAAGTHGEEPAVAQRGSVQVAQAPQVRRNRAPAQAAGSVRARSTIVCEGGKMQTMANGKKSCICPPGVNRIALTDTHFRCDRPRVTGSKAKGGGPEKKGPRAKALPDGKPAKKQAGSPGKPVPGGGAGAGKPVKQCGDPISSTRIAAVTRRGGSATAQAGWSLAVRKRYPNGWSNWNNARDRNTKCQFAGTWNCTATARPCAP